MKATAQEKEMAQEYALKTPVVHIILNINIKFVDKDVLQLLIDQFY